MNILKAPNINNQHQFWLHEYHDVILSVHLDPMDYFHVNSWTKHLYKSLKTSDMITRMIYTVVGTYEQKEEPWKDEQNQVMKTMVQQ